MSQPLSLIVHLHLHHLSMWPKIRANLKHLSDYPYTLFITYTCKKELISAELLEEIAALNQKAIIRQVPNRGYDVGPFIYFLHQINLNDYDLLLKIHTKNDQSGYDTHIDRKIISRRWFFKLAIEALIGSKQQFEDNLRQFGKNRKLGLIGSRYLTTQNLKVSKKVNPQVFALTYKLTHHILNEYKFVAGTMFMCRASLMQPFKEYFCQQDFAPTQGSVTDGTLAHVLERLFCVLVTEQGYTIEGFDKNLQFETEQKRNLLTRPLIFNVVDFAYSNRITKTHHHLVKLFKIPVYHRLLH